MKAFRGDRNIAASLLTSGLDGDFPSGKKPNTQ
jgi:cell shape-determining protein MreC